MPQEEVPLYESKGKQFVNRHTKPSEPVRLPTGHTAHTSIPGLFILDDKEKKHTKKKSSAAKVKVEEVTKQLENVKIVQEQKTIDTDPAKRLKNLKKKLREIEALEEKLKKGEITKPEPEQLAKVKRKNDLLMEINQVEKKV